jgi:hypothetical protein
VSSTSDASPSPAPSATRSDLETAFRMLEKSTDAFPTLKFAVDGLVARLNVTQAVATDVVVGISFLEVRDRGTWCTMAR